MGSWSGVRINATHTAVYILKVVKDLKYADSHEWVKVDGTSATIGITDHAQDHLGDVVYVELPDVGASVTQGTSFGAVESVKDSRQPVISTLPFQETL
ncbi:glycine cleavage system H protein 2, mitochondrial-like isoform X2 [Tasmannia lanceolata]|uniref:glycine cleavage system H protein 2, mitochondrial-like isoform X2 n=1 Tax=Tasmannia lanceolata TaxID=3420 RepID=UPI00406365DC